MCLRFNRRLHLHHLLQLHLRLHHRLCQIWLLQLERIKGSLNNLTTTYLHLQGDARLLHFLRRNNLRNLLRNHPHFHRDVCSLNNL